MGIWILKMRKSLAFVVAVGAVVYLAGTGVDKEILIWVGGFISAMASALFIGQGLKQGKE